MKKSGLGMVVAILTAFLVVCGTTAQDNFELVDAAFQGDIQKVAQLLRLNINPNAFDRKGVNALAAASANGHSGVVKLLLENGADVNAKDPSYQLTALFPACGGNHAEVVKILLNAGADPNVKSNPDMITPLITAVVGGSQEIVRLLLSAGADPNIVHRTGLSPLMVASKGGYGEIVKMLLQHGANPYAKAESGETALSLATQKGYSEVVELLTKKETPPLTVVEPIVDIDTPDPNRPIHLSIGKREKPSEIVRLLWDSHKVELLTLGKDKVPALMVIALERPWKSESDLPRDVRYSVKPLPKAPPLELNDLQPGYYVVRLTVGMVYKSSLGENTFYPTSYFSESHLSNWVGFQIKK